MELLTDAQITAELAAVPAWTRDGSSITTVTNRADFRDAMLYVGAVAYLPRAPATTPTSRSPGTR
jgi:pterin-4a-carbinolamine dehydratase